MTKAIYRRSCRLCRRPIARQTPCVLACRAWDVTNVMFREHGHEGCSSCELLHLACAIATKPQWTRDVLAKCELTSELVREVARISPAFAAELAVPVAPASAPVDDPVASALLDRLEADADRDLFVVLADHLIARADPRGELIATQLAGEEPAPELLAQLAPQLGKVCDVVWGIGFIRELGIPVLGYRFESRRTPLDHPSCRLLRELRVWTRAGCSIELAPGSVPRSLHVLDVQDTLQPTDLSWLPYLHTLEVEHCRGVTHPSVRTLVLDGTDLETLADCARGLPSLSRVVVGAAVLDEARAMLPAHVAVGTTAM